MAANRVSMQPISVSIERPSPEESAVNSKYLNMRWWWEVLEGTYSEYLARVGFTPEVIDKQVEDVSCKFFISNPTARVWYGDSHSDSSIELRFIRDHILKPGYRVVECGVHHGLETILLSRWVGSEGFVYACEPMPENVKVIQRNLDLNGIRNAKVVAKAVGPRPGKIAFRQKSNSAPMGNRWGRSIDVAMTTIDELCESENFRPDFIMIDVEGFEVEVLEGAARTLRHRPALVIEVHPPQMEHFNNTVEQLWSLIDTSQYQLWHQPHHLAEVRRIDGPIKIADRSHIFCIPKQS
jgi:FkbM family methyltransferase